MDRVQKLWLATNFQEAVHSARPSAAARGLLRVRHLVASRGADRRRQPSRRFWCPQAQIYAHQRIRLDGLGRPPSIWARSMSALSRCFERGPSCSSTRRRCRCSIPVERAPRLASFGPMPPVTGPWRFDLRGIAYVHAPDRKAERLFRLQGALQIDGYNAYLRLAGRSAVEFAFLCWVHMRRNLYELATASPAPIASEALQHIAAFYAIEKEIRGRSAEECRLVRQQKSRPRPMPLRYGCAPSWFPSARR